MSSVRQYMNTTSGWAHTSAAVQANEDDLPHLQPSRVKLDGFRDRAEALSNEQSAFAAGKQEATRQLQEVLRAGNALADLLRTGVREHYGPSSEKLVEFGIQPFRGRTKKAQPPLPEEPEPEPEPGPESTELLSPASTPDTVK